MDMQISVFLLFILFNAGQSLNCYQCMNPNSFCPNVNVTTCPSGASGCLSWTFVKPIDENYTVNNKNCYPDFCVNGYINLGFVKASFLCCDTDFCNAQNPPDPRTLVPNGKRCYSCNETNCSNIVSCSGREDRCITATANGIQPTRYKGCVSKSICEVAASVGNVTGVSCCSGNLCNGAQSVTQSFLFLCCSLISFVLMT